MRKEVDSNEYESEDKYERFIFYRRKKFINPTMRNNRNRLLLKRVDTYYPVDVGEYMAYIIGNRTIGNFCDVELSRYCCNFTDSKYEAAVISYYYYSDDDKLCFPRSMLEEYYKLKGKSSDILNKGYTNIDDCIEAVRLFFGKNHRPLKEFQNFKEQFIDMVMFDAKFGNYDRNLNNWLLFRSHTSGEITLYPLFDNEAILGFDLPTNQNEAAYPIVKKILEEASNLELFETTDENPNNKSSIYDVVRHVAEKYPNEAKKSYEKLNKFTEKDLLEELDHLPEPLSKERRKFTLERFLAYGALFEKAYQKGLEKVVIEEKSKEEY